MYVKNNSFCELDHFMIWLYPHDGKHDFYLDFSGNVPVTYVSEHR